MLLTSFIQINKYANFDSVTFYNFFFFQVPYISNPFRPNTVSTKHLLTVSIASPFFVIALVEAVVFMISNGQNKLRKYFHFTTSIYLIYLASFVIATFIMEVLFLHVFIYRFYFHIVRIFIIV